MVWTKRAKFILVSAFLSLGLLVIQFVSFSFRYQAIGIFMIVTYIASAWVLYEEMVGIHWLMCLILPCTYMAGVALFYFLLPEKMILRFLILLGFSIGMYAILLTENIFSIASGKTIQLLRAAQAVGFLMTLIAAFFIFNTIFSFKFSPWSNGFLVMLASIPLYWQSIWSLKLTTYFEKDLLSTSVILALISGELGMAISFWPLSILIASLFLVAFFYVSIGLLQHKFSGKLFENTYKEYLQIAAVVLIITYIMAGWGGR